MEYSKDFFEKVFSNKRMERYFRLYPEDENRAIYITAVIWNSPKPFTQACLSLKLPSAMCYVGNLKR